MRKSAGHCWCIFPVDCFPCRKTGSQWDIKGKAKPKQCYMFVLLPACVRVCVSASVCVLVRCHIDTSQLSSISSHNPSKQAAIHPSMEPCIYLSIYPCSCPSVRLMSLASITMYHATHVFSLALYVGVKSLTCASIDAALQRPPPPAHVARSTRS